MWQEAAAIAGLGAFGATLVLAIVTWVQGKQAAHRDLVSFYHELSSRVLFPMRKQLASCSQIETMTAGMNGRYLGGGPVAEWWQELEEKEPGLINHLPDSLLETMEQFQNLARQCDSQRRETWLKFYEILADVADPEREIRKEREVLPELRVYPPGIDGPYLNALWARGISLQQWIDETAKYRSGQNVSVSISFDGTVIGQNAVAIAMVDKMMTIANEDKALSTTRTISNQGVEKAKLALTLVHDQIAKKPQKRIFWPRLSARGKGL